MNILLLGPLWRNKSIKEFLERDGHVVTTREDAVTLADTQRDGIELILSSGYAPIIRPDVVNTFPQRIINLHATFLPYGKGIGTTFFSVFEGTPTGISLHHIEVTVDTGDVLFREEVPYSESDTLRTMHRKLLHELEKFFRLHWNQIRTGEYKAIPQSAYGIHVPYRSRVDSERFMDLLIQKWDTPLVDVARLGADFLLGEDFWDAYDREFDQAAPATR